MGQFCLRTLESEHAASFYGGVKQHFYEIFFYNPLSFTFVLEKKLVKPRCVTFRCKEI